MEFWELWGIGKQKRRDDDEGYDKVDEKKERLEEVEVLVHTLFSFWWAREGRIRGLISHLLFSS